LKPSNCIAQYGGLPTPMPAISEPSPVVFQLLTEVYCR
jgi:hypothetical protein